jgi:hypothetical protein
MVRFAVRQYMAVGFGHLNSSPSTILVRQEAFSSAAEASQRLEALQSNAGLHPEQFRQDGWTSSDFQLGSNVYTVSAYTGPREVGVHGVCEELEAYLQSCSGSNRRA